jgi:hypothetical protein
MTTIANMLMIILLRISSSESLQVTGCNVQLETCNIVMVFIFSILIGLF